MGRIRWHKRDHNAALTGMANLTLEERGAYNTILDLIYTHDGAVDDDARYISGWLRCDPRIWKRIRGELLRLGKLYEVGGKLRNERCDLEVDKANHRLNCDIHAGLMSAASKGYDISKNKHLLPSHVQRALQQPTPRKKDLTYLSTEPRAREALARSPGGELRASPPTTAPSKRPSEVTRAELDAAIAARRTT